MRRSGALLGALCLLGGCAQADESPVPADFQQIIRDISGVADPDFAGSTCATQAPDRREGYRYTAELTVQGTGEQVRKAAIERGWQPYRTKDREELLVGKSQATIIVGFAEDGKNTKVSAVMESNCVSGPENPLVQELRTADPDLQPTQKQRLAAAYQLVRTAGVTIGPLLDPGHVDPEEIPWPPPVPDYFPRVNLEGCVVNDRGALGARWLADYVVDGFITDTTDVKTGEQRVVAALGDQWKISERKDDVITFERSAGAVPGMLSLRITQQSGQRGVPGLHLKGQLSTGCVPPTIT
ncbi:hypothetical protein LWC34_11300 [Kibdelosporangium philippinense]|uniref:Lipoprotein n=1 Tax=Kibdelosporangium philippinense TaxID=211113 RepID=A0ABS8Z6H2_9PSEU|nr:hypothetical protein [Kibdelosporangium philippinense]MCE7003410.1 hypothetical protein [Kibdelosporangium philippinense]